MFLTFTKGRRDVLSTYLSRLESMQGALRESAFFKTHEVIGSSLLFVHDRQGRANVWMIDFGKTLPAPAHLALRHDVAWTRGNHEDGYLIGLRRLADSLGAALRQMEQPGEDGAATEPGAAPTPPQETQQGGSPDAGGVGGSSTAERGRCHQHGGEPARQQTPAGRRNASHPTSLAPDGSTPPSPQPGTSARGRVLNRGVCGGDPS
uniref:Kinase n=1 Tax=Sphenodon punctatus TaxID=8508 RepID=A0A8D0HIK4_SPHPU